MGHYLIRDCELADLETFTTRRAQILIGGNRIEKIGKTLTPPPGCEVIEAQGMLALPSFADCHSHLTQTFMKGPLDDYPITSWLVKLFAVEGIMSEEENYYSCLLGCLTALRCGTTAINDMAKWPLLDSTIEAVRDSRIRATIGVTIADVAENEAMPLVSIDEALRRTEAVCDRVRQDRGRLRASAAPVGLPACSGEMVRSLKLFAKEKGLILHTHLAEGRKETEMVRKRFGLAGEAEALYECGALDPNTLLAHSIWLSDHELDLLRETGAHPVHCPSTNLKISDGMPPIAEMVKKGIAVTLGCDGEASSSNRDMIREGRLAAYLQKGRTLDAAVLPAAEVYRMMTINGMRALGYEDLGELREGYTADLILVDMDHDLSLLNPSYRLNNFLYAANGQAVDSVFLDGELLVRKGRFTFVDEEAVMAGARRAVESLNRKIARL